LRTARHRQAIKPIPLRQHIPGGFTRDDFTIDHTAGSARCPAGHTATITPTGTASFRRHCNAPCPLRARCTTSTGGGQLQLSTHDRELVEARRAWRDGEILHDYRRYRPMVERSLAWLVRNGNRRVRYRGLERNALWLGLRVAAINLRRLVNLGLTRDGPTWSIT
jgi:Transposase DDE domain